MDKFVSVLFFALKQGIMTQKVVKNVPCEECEQCGAKYYSDETARQLEKLVDTAKQLMQEISVINYTKAA